MYTETEIKKYNIIGKVTTLLIIYCMIFTTFLVFDKYPKYNDGGKILKKEVYNFVSKGGGKIVQYNFIVNFKINGEKNIGVTKNTYYSHKNGDIVYFSFTKSPPWYIQIIGYIGLIGWICLFIMLFAALISLL